MLEDNFFAEKPSYKGLFQLLRLLYDGTVNTKLSECVGSACLIETDLKKSAFTLITPKTSLLLESFRGKKNLIAVRYSKKHSGKYYVRVTDFIDKGEFLKLICAFPSDTSKYNLGEWKSYPPDEKRKTSEQGDIVAFTFWEKKVIKLHFMNDIVKLVENAKVIPPSAVGATIFDVKNMKAIGMVTRDSNGDLKPKLFTTEDISYLTGNGETTQPTETDEQQPSTSYETDCRKPIQDNMPHTQQAYQARHKQDTSYTAKESKIKAGQMQTEGERMRAKDEQQPSTSYETDCGKPNLVDTAPHQPDPPLSETYPQPILPLVETAGSPRRKIRSGDDIQTLWAESPSHTFDKDLSHLLDTEYHCGIESGLQLAKLLGIDGEQRKTFTRASISSRSEKLFEILATIQPDLKVKDLSKALEDIKNIAAFNVLEHAKSAKPKDGGCHITDETKVADLLNSHGKVIGQLSLELDKGPQNWKDLSFQLEVPRSYTKELSRPDGYKSPTREMIEHFIPVRKPSLTVESLVKLFNEKNAPTALVKKLENLKQDLPIKHLPNKEVMDNLEDYLDAGEWKTVAENLGLCDNDISCIEPIPSREIGVTEAMFVWLRSAKPKTFTVAQLVIQLAIMKRRDCLDLIASQMEDGKVTILKILKEARLEVEGLE